MTQPQGPGIPDVPGGVTPNPAVGGMPHGLRMPVMGAGTGPVRLGPLG